MSDPTDKTKPCEFCGMPGVVFTSRAVTWKCGTTQAPEGKLMSTGERTYQHGACKEIVRLLGERDEARKHLAIMVDLNVCIVDPACGDCYVCNARAVVAGPRFKIGEKVIGTGSDPVGEVLQVNPKGVLVQWPPSFGEHVRPCWYHPDDLRLAEPNGPEAQEVEGPMPVCLTCSQNKKPYGRDAGPAHIDMCGYHCSGYRENPFPRLHWPGEKCEASQGKSTCAICGRATPDAHPKET